MDDSHFQKFSESARRVLLTAQYMASESGLPTTTEHILLAILTNKDSLAHSILLGHDVTAEKVEAAVNRVVDKENVPQTLTPTLAADTKAALDRAMNIASQYGHVGVDTEHVLLALLSNDQSSAYILLKRIGSNPERIKDQILNLFSELLQLDEAEGILPEMAEDHEVEEEMPNRKRGKRNSSALEYFTTDITKLSEEGKLDPVIGRAQEIERVVKVLSRRTKNNPVLIGEPGVGKTAIVEGLAQRVVKGDVPITLLGKRVLTLDLALLVAGTMYRGQFEERIKKVIDELQKLDNAIIFIDELHTIIGAGSAEGSLDAAQILKPSLAKGQLRLIGATTLNEYQKHIEKDAALTRRFQTVVVTEPTVEDTFAILTGIKSRYEEHHQVTFSDNALWSAIRLSQRYIADRFLPDKAIDLIDETAAAVHVHNPREKQALLLSRDLDQAIAQKEQAVLKEQYDLASRLQRKEELLRKQIERIHHKSSQGKTVVIESHDIEKTVAIITGIPVGNLAGDELVHVSNIEKTLSARVIGQEEAVSAVARAIRRARTGIGQPYRPVGSFIFLGPSGVGKSELAKVIARHVYGRESALVKIDMSEFMERHNVSRLLGAPAGYIGYEEGGKLTETIRRQPYSVVLLDEIEKAHPDVFNILLQILEDGYITDAKGRQIDFRNTVVIMTSNIGMEELTNQAHIGFNATNPHEEKVAMEQFESVKANLLKNLRYQFRPEFLNRLDQIIVFRPLSKEHIRKIVDLQISDLISRAKIRGITIQVDLPARKFLVQQGYDAQNGARPIRRAIQTMIEDKIADAILSGVVDANKAALVRREGEELVLA